jgi:outer membrane protein insertion porin family
MSLVLGAGLFGTLLCAQDRSIESAQGDNPSESREELPPPFVGGDEPQLRMPDGAIPQPIRPNDFDLKRRKPGREVTPALVVDVIIRGTRNEERARSLIKTRKEHDFDVETVTADQKRLIMSGRFRNAVPYIRDVEGGKVVIFEVTDRPMVNHIHLIGNRKYSDRSLIKKTGLKIGEPLSQFEVDEGRRRLEEHYQAQGFSKIRVGVLEGDKPDDQGIAYIIDEGNFQRIGAVYFKGNSFVPDGVLRSKVSSLPPYLYLGWFRGKFDRSKIDEDVNKITSYYRDYGFFKARIGREIEFDEEGRWATLTFVIDEGPRYKVRDIKVEGAEIFHTSPLVEAMKMKSDAYFRRGDMQRDEEMLKSAYGAMGHVFADIAAEQRFTDEPGQIDMIYRIKEGEPWRVGEVNVFIAGEFPRTRRNVVLNRLSLRSGDLIDIREIRDSERRLEYSALFETPQTAPGSEPPKIVVRPPELRDVGLASDPKKSRRRGQSPDDNTLPAAKTHADSGRFWNKVATMPVLLPPPPEQESPDAEEPREVRPGQFSSASDRTEFQVESQSTR